MEFLAGYGSDQDEEQEDKGIQRPLKRVKHGVVNGDGSLAGLDSRKPEAVRNVRQGKRPSLPRSGKTSRWTTSSAFLAPIAYDREYITEDAQDEEEDDAGVKLTSVGDSRPSLSQCLPAPIHETTDKSGGNIVKESPMPTVREPESRPSVCAPDVKLGVDAAPNVGGWHADPLENRGASDESVKFADIVPSGVQIKEISGADLRGDAASAGREGSGMRAALGAEYENKLSAEAARVGSVSKLAKRKNQLSSLFQSAKSQEIEQMEKQATGIKTKAETQKKYGW